VGRLLGAGRALKGAEGGPVGDNLEEEPGSPPLDRGLGLALDLLGDVREDDHDEVRPDRPVVDSNRLLSEDETVIEQLEDNLGTRGALEEKLAAPAEILLLAGGGIQTRSG